MNSLSPVPIPASRRWQEIRCRFLPGLIFVAALLVAVVLWRQVVHSPSWPSPAGAGLAIQNGDPLPESAEQAYLFRGKASTHRSGHHNQRVVPSETNRPGTALTYGNGLNENGAAFPLVAPRSGSLFPTEAVGAKGGANPN
jgi:hypothetical protein